MVIYYVHDLFFKFSIGSQFGSQQHNIHPISFAQSSHVVTYIASPKEETSILRIPKDNLFILGINKYTFVFMMGKSKRPITEKNIEFWGF
jgi:hypothetical protein